MVHLLLIPALWMDLGGGPVGRQGTHGGAKGELEVTNGVMSGGGGVVMWEGKGETL